MTRRLLLTIVSVLLAAPSFAEQVKVEPRARTKERVRRDWSERFQDSRHGPEVTERFTRAIRIGPTGSFDLFNLSGDVVVTGGGGDEVRIDAIKRARARDASDGKALLDELRIEVTELPNRVQVRTMHPRHRRNYSGSVDYTVTVPTGSAAAIKTMSGNIRVTNVKGELHAETMSGDIAASGVAVVSMIKSASGNVRITNATASGGVTASILSGALTVSGVKARSLDLGSVSGDVIVTDVSCERAKVKSMSGNVEYSGALARTGQYEMTAHSGNVRLAVSDTTGFELTATTFSGEVRSDFPLTLRAGIENSGMRRSRPNRSIRGSFGDASAIVNLTSFSGNIVVTKR